MQSFSCVDFIWESAQLRAAASATPVAAAETTSRSKASRARAKSKYNGEYSGERLNRVAFPMGGIGAGMICLEGSGALSHVSLRHRPEVFNEPVTFAALCVKGGPNVARVLQGPVPDWKKFGQGGSGNGASGAAFGLPRFHEATFSTRFPFATIELEDKDVPLAVAITGWSPFEPGDADNASLPVAAMEYRFTNKTGQPREAVFSWSARNFMVVGKNTNAVKSAPGGFMLWSAGPQERGWEEGAFTATVDDPAVKVDHAWFRGGWFDPLTIAWKEIADGKCYDHPPVTEGGASPGGTLFVPFTLAARASKTIVLRFAWHVGQTNLRIGKDPEAKAGEQTVQGNYKPWYAGRFANIGEVTD